MGWKGIKMIDYNTYNNNQKMLGLKDENSNSEKWSIMWKEKINNSIANCYKNGNVVWTGIMLKSIITNMYEHIF